MAKVLVVDDDLNFGELLRSLLAEVGHDVVLATDGAQAVEQIRVEKFDVLILDLIMPKKDGLEVLIDMRQRHQDLQVIAMSGGGYGSAADYLSWAKTLGVRETLAKPFSRDELLVAIEKCLTQQ